MPKVNNTKIDDEEDDDDEVKVRYLPPPMIEFKGIGAFKLHGINSFEKEFEVNAESTTLPFKFGISINKGMNPSTFYPKVDVFIWFNDEKERDDEYDRIKEAMVDSGVIFF